MVVGETGMEMWIKRWESWIRCVGGGGGWEVGRIGLWMRGRQGESEAVMVRWRVAGRKDEGLRSDGLKI